MPDNEKIVFRGKIGEVVHIAMSGGRVFEQYRRPPGIRLIIISKDNRILITKEFRHESKSYDLRLPGGKVCDSLDQYDQLRASGADMAEAATAAAIKEAREETGLDIQSPELISIANAGATVDWDLYYFVVHDYTERPDGQLLEHGEDIKVSWMKPTDIIDAIAAGEMQEWRSVGVLLGKVLPGLATAS